MSSISIVADDYCTLLPPTVRLLLLPAGFLQLQNCRNSLMIYRFVSHLQTVCFCCVFVTFSAEGSLQERAGESRDGDQENHSHHSRVQTGSDPASSVNTFLQTRHVFGFFFLFDPPLCFRSAPSSAPGWRNSRRRPKKSWT